jgi:hypothetical protein
MIRHELRNAAAKPGHAHRWANRIGPAIMSGVAHQADQVSLLEGALDHLHEPVVMPGSRPGAAAWPGRHADRVVGDALLGPGEGHRSAHGPRSGACGARAWLVEAGAAAGVPGPDKAFGVEVAVPPDAPAYDRLA